MSAVFPIGVLLTGRRCLVVGSSPEAAARAEQLLKVGASVRLVSPAPGPEVLALQHLTAVELIRRPFAASDLHGCWLAVLADRDEGLAQALSTEAEASCVFFCAVDQPVRNTFAHLAIARSGALVVGVSSSGASPAFARRLRDELQRVLEEAGISGFLVAAAELRHRLLPAQRRDALTSLMSRVRLTGTLSVPALPAHGGDAGETQPE